LCLCLRLDPKVAGRFFVNREPYKAQATQYTFFK